MIVCIKISRQFEWLFTNTENKQFSLRKLQWSVTIICPISVFVIKRGQLVLYMRKGHSYKIAHNERREIYGNYFFCVTYVKEMYTRMQMLYYEYIHRNKINLLLVTNKLKTFSCIELVVAFDVYLAGKNNREKNVKRKELVRVTAIIMNLNWVWWILTLRENVWCRI